MTDQTIDQLERLETLRNRGALTDEELTAQKAALLERNGTTRDEEEPGYDGATENLALAGYVFAIVFPIVGLILGIMLLGRNRPKAGWIVIAISCLIIVAGMVLGLALLTQESQPVDGGLEDAILGE